MSLLGHQDVESKAQVSALKLPIWIFYFCDAHLGRLYLAPIRGQISFFFKKPRAWLTTTGLRPPLRAPPVPPPLIFRGCRFTGGIPAFVRISWSFMLLTRIGLACASLLLCASVLGQTRQKQAPSGRRTFFTGGYQCHHGTQPGTAAAFKFRRQALEAERWHAGLKPEVRLSAEAENIAGSGDYTGGQSAETTLAISSIIELGGKARCA